jgi:hypothetical protein
MFTNSFFFSFLLIALIVSIYILLLMLLDKLEAMNSNYNNIQSQLDNLTSNYMDLKIDLKQLKQESKLSDQKYNNFFNDRLINLSEKYENNNLLLLELLDLNKIQIQKQDEILLNQKKAKNEIRPTTSFEGISHFAIKLNEIKNNVNIIKDNQGINTDKITTLSKKVDDNNNKFHQMIADLSKKKQTYEQPKENITPEKLQKQLNLITNSTK